MSIVKGDVGSETYEHDVCRATLLPVPIPHTRPRKQSQQSMGKSARLHGGLTLSTRYRREWVVLSTLLPSDEHPGSLSDALRARECSSNKYHRPDGHEDAREDDESIEVRLVDRLEECTARRRPNKGRDREEDVHRSCRGVSSYEAGGRATQVRDIPSRAPYTSRGVMTAMYVASRDTNAPV